MNVKENTNSWERYKVMGEKGFMATFEGKPMAETARETLTEVVGSTR